MNKELWDGGTIRTPRNIFSFDLPPELVAQDPAPHRDTSRLLVLHRASGRIEHERFPQFPGHLGAGDLLVLNDSKVLRARLRSQKEGSGGKIEILLLEQNQSNDWWAMLKPGKRVRMGVRLRILCPDGNASGHAAEVVELDSDGKYRLRFDGPDILGELERLGEMPLPPYIKRGSPVEWDAARYQTVFAAAPGSVAAPTAGLHFSAAILEQIRARGVRIAFVTLHVGAGTFAPVKADFLEDHRMHAETFLLPEETARAVNATKQAGGRVVAVGTTSLRVLESAAAPPGGDLKALAGRTTLFVYPPWRFQVADALLTNFHLPESTLLMLVSAFAAPETARGWELIRAAYAEAIRQRYRFYSYGDAMLIE